MVARTCGIGAIEAVEHLAQHVRRHPRTGIADGDLDLAVRRVLAGEIENAMCAVGILAADRVVRDGFQGLRPSDAPWPSRKGTSHL